jgi:GNAT superfamily N-acetyltransferase
VTVTVRRAADGDVEAMSRVLTASITELCVADHGGNPAAIARWTANKTPEEVTKMLAALGTDLFIAEREGAVAAVGCIVGTSEIGLNYVHPDHRFMGVSKALLDAMEESMRARGVGEAALVSTVTAHRFYLAAGWEDVGGQEARFGMTCFPMRKTLRRQDIS